jgi:L-alanine-DL-glutamate epimerase-like enolase superfamily enzyme
MPVSRREFLSAAGGASLAPVLRAWESRSASVAAPKASDVRIEEVQHSYEDYLYRAPIKFGGNVVDRVSLLNVRCVVRTRSGKVARGFGSMPLGNVWSFPSRTMPYEVTLGAMKALADRMVRIAAACKEIAHPVELDWALEPEYLSAAAEVSRELALKEPLPKLAVLTTASPFGAALHDAFGKVHGRSVYTTYGPDFMSRDLSAYLGPEFEGEHLGECVLATPKPTMPLYHLVGALDPLEDADVTKRLGDGLPETLPEWIRRSGLTHLKVKLNGDDLVWDVDRVVRVDRLAAETQGQRGVSSWSYSLDFNERCPNVAYLVDVLRLVREKTPAGFERIQYVEQPTGRDLKANRANVVHEASRLRPVVIDESLTDQESLMLAREMGYTGAALKACKGQSQALLMGAAAQKARMFLCVQDLTCPGASFLHSAGLAAHVPGVAAIEGNARQYVPSANKGWEERFPGVFDVHDGQVRTGAIRGPGLGAVALDGCLPTGGCAATSEQVRSNPA